MKLEIGSNITSVFGTDGKELVILIDVCILGDWVYVRRYNGETGVQMSSIEYPLMRG